MQLKLLIVFCVAPAGQAMCAIGMTEGFNALSMKWSFSGHKLFVAENVQFEKTKTTFYCWLVYRVCQ